MLKTKNIKANMISQILLSFALALILIIPAFAVPDVAKAATFKDINSHWAQSYIQRASAKGLVKGFDDGTFRPDQPVTRAEFTAMVNRLLGNSNSETLSFYDVSRSEWYYNDISKALYASYVGGYNDGTFKPNNPASRQEAAIMIARFLPISGINGSTYGFNDSASIASWASEAVGKVSARGYLKGYDDGAFHAQDPITRAMLAKILCEISEKETIITSNTTISSNNTTLSNSIYSNGITISSSLREGNASISNCVVLGTLTINGGGENSIRIDNSRVANANIRKSGLPVRVIASANTSIVKANLGDKAILETSNLSGGLFGKGFENINIERSSESTLRGNFPLVNINGKSNLTLQSGTIDKLEASSYATDSTIKIENRARINTANISAKLAFKGDGDLVELNAKASGITYTKKPARIYTASGISQPTEDTSANLEVQVTPKDKATSVSKSSDIELNFKDSIKTSSNRSITESYVKDYIHLRKDRRNGSTVDFNVSISNSSRRIILDPKSNLDDDTTYYVVIDDRAFQYENGTKIREQITSFYTGKDAKIGDATFYPRDGATGVNKAVEPRIEFDDPIEFRNGSAITNSKLKEYITFRKNNSGGTKVNFTATIDSSNRRITIYPDSRLEDGQKYYLAISYGDFRFTKNSTSVRASAVTWTVGENTSGPKITISPQDGATNVNTTPTITISFDKAVYRNTNNDSLTDSHIKSAIKIRHVQTGNYVDYNLTSSSRSISLTPKSPLLPANRYEVTVSSNYFYDYYKNPNSSASAKFTVAGTIDLSRLTKAISDANAAKIGLKVAESEANAFTDENFVTQSVMNDFIAKIDEANRALSNSTSTNMANEAAKKLEDATTSFKAKAKRGTKTRVSTTELNNAITSAKSKLTATQKSDDGLDCPKDKKWATAGEFTTFENEIKKAEDYLAKPLTHTAGVIHTHTVALQNATATFGKDGKKPDKSELFQQMTDADKLRSETVESEDGASVETGKYWAKSSDYGAFLSAVDSARAVYDNQKADESAVNAETENLKNSIADFKTKRTKKE
ncbi:MAG: S-layer homology domain-containing protein [Eubacteriales bacterium]